MNAADAETDSLRARGPANPFSRVGLWWLVTLGGAILLAFLAGSATPRVRLLVLFPLAMGALVALGCLSLLKLMELELSGLMLGWVVLLAAAVPAGSAVQSWRLWRSELREQRAGFIQQIERMMANTVDLEQAEDERRKLARAFAEKTTFPVYLSHRLEAFAKQVGRREVWAPPLPELLFAFEMLVAAIAALSLCLPTWRMARRPADWKESPS